MKPYLKKTMHLAIGLALTGVLFACNGSPLQLQGRQVPLNERQSIEDGGPHQAQVVKPGAVIQYSYVREADTLALQGTITFSRAKRANDYLLEHFYLRLYPLDNEGLILASQLVVSRTGVLNAHQFSFERQFEVPDTTTGVAWSLSSRWSRYGWK